MVEPGNVGNAPTDTSYNTRHPNEFFLNVAEFEKNRRTQWTNDVARRKDD